MKTGVVERLIAQLGEKGPSTAADLARATGLPNSSSVSAVLKSRIESGQVERSGNRWALNPDWDEMLASELRDARMLLERAGYRVVKVKTDA